MKITRSLLLLVVIGVCASQQQRYLPPNGSFNGNKIGIKNGNGQIKGINGIASDSSVVADVDYDSSNGVLGEEKFTNGIRVNGNGVTNGFSNGITNGASTNGYSNGVTNGANGNGQSNGAPNGGSRNGYSNGASNGASRNGQSNGVPNGGSRNGYNNGATKGGNGNGITNGAKKNGIKNGNGFTNGANGIGAAIANGNGVSITNSDRFSNGAINSEPVRGNNGDSDVNGFTSNNIIQSVPEDVDLENRFVTAGNGLDTSQSASGAETTQPGNGNGVAFDESRLDSTDQAFVNEEGFGSNEAPLDPIEALGRAIAGGGTPGVDYPILASVPETDFTCDGRVGYYADTSDEAKCQVFHICQEDGRMDAFLCPNGTLFNQRYFVCDWWFNVDCSGSEQFFILNEDIGKTDFVATGVSASSDEPNGFVTLVQDEQQIIEGQNGQIDETRNELTGQRVTENGFTSGQQHAAIISTEGDFTNGAGQVNLNDLVNGNRVPSINGQVNGNRQFQSNGNGLVNGNGLSSGIDQVNGNGQSDTTGQVNGGDLSIIDQDITSAGQVSDDTQRGDESQIQSIDNEEQSEPEITKTNGIQSPTSIINGLANQNSYSYDVPTPTFVANGNGHKNGNGNGQRNGNGNGQKNGNGNGLSNGNGNGQRNGNGNGQKNGNGNGLSNGNGNGHKNGNGNGQKNGNGNGKINGITKVNGLINGNGNGQKNGNGNGQKNGNGNGQRNGNGNGQRANGNGNGNGQRTNGNGNGEGYTYTVPIGNGNGLPGSGNGSPKFNGNEGTISVPPSTLYGTPVNGNGQGKSFRG